MDESAPMRALIVGVSVFMALATVTCIMVYYNTAKSTADVVGSAATDISGNYDASIENMLLEGGTITGTDVINLLNYYKDNTNVKINVEYICFVKEEDTVSGCVANFCTQQTRQENLNNNPNSETFNKWIKRILPNQPFEIKVTNNSDLTKEINLTGKYDGVNI